MVHSPLEMAVTNGVFSLALTVLCCAHKAAAGIEHVWLVGDMATGSAPEEAEFM